MPARCPLCLRCHGPAPGDSGGTMYSDAALAAADKERKMIQKLCKYGLIRAGTLEAQLQSVATCRRAEPRDLQAHANAVRVSCSEVRNLRGCSILRAPLLYAVHPLNLGKTLHLSQPQSTCFARSLLLLIVLFHCPHFHCPHFLPNPSSRILGRQGFGPTN